MIDYKAVVENLVKRQQELGMPTQMEVTEERIMIQFGENIGISQRVHAPLKITNETWRFLLESWCQFVYKFNDELQRK